MPSHTVRPPCAPCAKPAPSPLTVEDAAAALHAAGFTPGTPAHVSAYARRIDAGACRRMRCGRCGVRRMAYSAWQNGPRDRALAVCGVCHSTEEV